MFVIAMLGFMFAAAAVEPEEAAVLVLLQKRLANEQKEQARHKAAAG